MSNRTLATAVDGSTVLLDASAAGKHVYLDGIPRILCASIAAANRRM